jgi:hypothetical protein
LNTGENDSYPTHKSLKISERESTMKYVIISAALFFLSVGVLFAQDTIPNAGFEHWTLGNPDHWIVDNLPAVYVPVTKSTDPHGGSFALQGQVVDVSGFGGMPPVVSTTFSVGANYGSLTGFYKFSPIGGDSLLIMIYMTKQLSAIGIGLFQTGTSSSTYMEFSAAVDYFAAGPPDSAWIEFLVQSSAPHVGTTFKIDDLAFGPVTGVIGPAATRPVTFSLSQNYPNPFNPSTAIDFSLPHSGFVTLRVLNVLGEEVARLIEGEVEAGPHTVQWNAGTRASGMYYYELRSGEFTQTKKLMLLK